MAEIKNTFVKSKMDKDLDARLLPKGVYREGVNISVSTSEGDDVGSLENIPGNVDLTNFNLDGVGLEVIGHCVDSRSDDIFLFITNYSDTSTNELDRFALGPATSSCIKQNIQLNITQNITGGTPGVYPSATYTPVALGSFTVLVNGSGVVSSVVMSSPATGNSGFQVGDVLTFPAAQFGAIAPDLQITIRQEDLHYSNGSQHYIVRYNAISQISEILVQGNFLNFSKTHRIQANLLEDLLFFTDNRNQPRKININTAIQNPITYYTSEDHVSVAKFSPVYSPEFVRYDNVSPVAQEYKSTLKNTWDEWLPPFFTGPADIAPATAPLGANSLFFRSSLNTGYDDLTTYIDNTGTILPPNTEFKLQNLTRSGEEEYLVYQIQSANEMEVANSSGVRIIQPFSTALPTWQDGDVYAVSSKNPDYDSTASSSGSREFMEEKFVKFSYRFKYEDDEYSLYAPFSQHAFVPKQLGSFIYGQDDEAKESGLVNFMENQINYVDLVCKMPYVLNDLKEELKIKQIDILYKASDENSIKVVAELNEDDFTKAPLTNINIIGFAGGTGYNPGTFDVEVPSATGTGAIFRLTFTGPPAAAVLSSVSYNPGESRGQGYKVGQLLQVPAVLSGSYGPGSGAVIGTVSAISNELIYTYNCTQPIKTLPERVLTRASDITPIRALTQEIVGNRVVYGNFLQNSETINNLDYNVEVSEKENFSGSARNTLPQTRREYYNHTVKQGRTYSVGFILYDRFGRSSNLIINEKSDVNGVSNSTIYTPFTDGGISPMDWPGNSLKIILNEKIPQNKLGEYIGLWSETNPLGWYSYRVVVKQEEQEYYNVYVPGALSGNVTWEVEIDAAASETTDASIKYDNLSHKAHISLFNDNINKVTRSLRDVGDTDEIFSSDTVLYNRLYLPNTNWGTPLSGVSANNGYPEASRQNRSVVKLDVEAIKQWREFGEWVSQKNIEYTPAAAYPFPGGSFPTSQKYAYPGPAGNVDPLFLGTSGNPFIATISTDKRLGYTANLNGSAGYYTQDNSGGTTDILYSFAKELMVFETKPNKSLLDIYYETSSTGLISDLNTLVDGTLPPSDMAGSSNTTFSWNETDTINASLSNEFQALDASGNSVADSSIQCEIDQMIDANGNIVSPSNYVFDIVEASPSSPPSTQATFKYELLSPIPYVNNSATLNNYTVKKRFTRSNGQTILVQDQNLTLGNVDPNIIENTLVCIMYQESTGIDTTVAAYDYDRVIYKYVNEYTWDPAFGGTPPPNVVVPPMVPRTIFNDAMQKQGSFGGTNPGGYKGRDPLFQFTTSDTSDLIPGATGSYPVQKQGGLNVNHFINTRTNEPPFPGVGQWLYQNGKGDRVVENGFSGDITGYLAGLKLELNYARWRRVFVDTALGSWDPNYVTRIQIDGFADDGGDTWLDVLNNDDDVNFILASGSYLGAQNFPYIIYDGRRISNSYMKWGSRRFSTEENALEIEFNLTLTDASEGAGFGSVTKTIKFYILRNNPS